MLSLSDEISMVGFKRFQQMNETMLCKRTSKGDWGGICVIAVGDLYQLSPPCWRMSYICYTQKH